MRLVASSEGIGISSPCDGRISFFNSPYPAHHAFSAIDLYPSRFFGEAAPSPVRGRVVATRQFKCPEGKFFEGSRFDHVILIESLENPGRLAKILHVAPKVEAGDIVDIGQDLGALVRSGYFDFWTDPHIHVEVRLPSDPVRARGAFRMNRLIKIENVEPSMELRGEVIKVKPEYSLILLSDISVGGVTADVGGHAGILDAGVPHYGWIGVHMDEDPPLGGPVKLCGRKIGKVERAYSDMCLARCVDFDFRLGESSVLVSLYLNLTSCPIVKIMPRKPGSLRTEMSEEVSIDVVC